MQFFRAWAKQSKYGAKTFCRTHQVKGGKTCVNHTIVDYSSGMRRLHYAANHDEAKANAREIAQAVAEGKPDLLGWEDGLRVEMRKGSTSRKLHSRSFGKVVMGMLNQPSLSKN